MDKLVISRLATLPQQVKELKHDPRVRLQGHGGMDEHHEGMPASRAGRPSAAQYQQTPVQGFLRCIQDMQKLADDAFVNEDLRLSIGFNESVGRFIYRGLDRETGEVKREFPPEELLDTIVALRKIAGIAVDRKL